MARGWWSMTESRRLTIVACSESWAGMRADDEGRPVRTCEHCQARVTNVAELDAKQLEALVDAAARRRVCARVELVGARPRLRQGLAAGFVALALAGCAPELKYGYEHTIETDPEADGSWVGGLIRDYQGQPVAHALVVLQGHALPTELEYLTSEGGAFAFSKLSPGSYVIQVFAGRTSIRKEIELRVHVRVRADFRVNTEDELIGGLLLEPDVGSPASTYRID
jgi:hypothetical protein